MLSAFKMSTTNPFHIMKEPIQVSSRGVRDSIIAKLGVLYLNQPNPPFIDPFIKHLKLMGADKLDIYNKIVFILEEYNVNLEFITSRVGGEEMVYTFPKNPGPPPDELCRKKWLGIF